MSKLFRVLVTGSIGSGKTTACKLFEELGVPVFYSDEAARSLMDTNPFIMMNVKKYFGDDIYVKKYDKKKVSVKEELDRKKLASIVFNDKDKLDILNEIVHPAVGEAFEDWCEVQETILKDSEYVIEEAAIAIELDIHHKFDYIVVVTAEDSVRIERVMARDNCTRQDVIDRMNNQVSEEVRCSHADMIISNNNFPNLKCQISSANKKILKAIKSLQE